MREKYTDIPYFAGSAGKWPVSVNRRQTLSGGGDS